MNYFKKFYNFQVSGYIKICLFDIFSLIFVLRECGLCDTSSLKFVGIVILYSVTYLGCLNLFCCFACGSLFPCIFYMLGFRAHILLSLIYKNSEGLNCGYLPLQRICICFCQEPEDAPDLGLC